MKRFLALSILAAVAFAACSPSADAQMFRRRAWRNYNNGYNNGYYNNGWNNGYYSNPAAVPSYRTGGYQSAVVAPGIPTVAAPRAAVAVPGAAVIAPGTTFTPRAAVVAPGTTVVTPRAVAPVVTPAVPAVVAPAVPALRPGVRAAERAANGTTTIIQQP